MSEKLRVLVADDSIVYRKLISSILDQRDDIDLIGVAPNGAIALSKIDLKKPDLVLLDVAMPEKDGLEILEIMKEKYSDIDVIFISGMSRENAEITVKALELGALDFIPKPETQSPEESLQALTSALMPLLNLAKTRNFNRKIKTPSKRSTADSPTLEKGGKPEPESRVAIREPVHQIRKPISLSKREIPRINLITIGVSTGGPNALNLIVPKFRGDLPVPILAVQHMPPSFTASLAERLDGTSALHVLEAKSGDPIEKGNFYIAPGGKHMVVRRSSSGTNLIGLTESAPVHNCRPAVDVLFRSVAMTYGGNVLSIILTGMGSDGASGVAAIRRKGGYCLIQDEASSVVWGMPGAVLEAGEADEVLPLEKIPERVVEILDRFY